MKTVMDRCVQICNELSFPDTYYTPPFVGGIPKSFRYNLVHPNPIYGVPGRYISSGTELVASVSSVQPGLPLLVKLLEFQEAGIAEWNRPSLYDWRIGATKTEFTFNKSTQACVRLHICTPGNYGPGTTLGFSQIQTVLAPDYDIVSLRNSNTCGSTLGYKVYTLAPGACPN